MTSPVLLLFFTLPALPCDLEAEVLPKLYAALEAPTAEELDVAFTATIRDLQELDTRDTYLGPQRTRLIDEVEALRAAARESDLTTPDVRAYIGTEHRALQNEVDLVRQTLRQIIGTSEGTTAPQLPNGELSISEVQRTMDLRPNTTYLVAWTRAGSEAESEVRFRFEERTLNEILSRARDQQNFDRAILRALNNGIVGAQGDAGLKRLKGPWDPSMFEIKLFGAGLERRVYGCLVSGVILFVSVGGHSNSDIASAHTRCKTLHQ